MTRAEYAEYEKRVAEFIAREEISFLSTGTFDAENPEEDTGEPWFSWHPCECCGSPLGGMREYLYAVCKNTEQILRFEICEDCVYYVEYGRLDDSAMAEIEKGGAQ